MQEEAGRRRAIAESSAVQSKPQRKGVIIALNFVRRRSWWRGLSLLRSRGSQGGRRARGVFMGQKNKKYSSPSLFSLSESSCSPALPGEHWLRFRGFNVELGYF